MQPTGPPPACVVPRPAASLVYAVAHDVLAALLYDGYSAFSQTVSELGSVGTPTKSAVTVAEGTYALLLIPFGIGVWQSAEGRRSLRVVGVLLVASGLLFPLWLPFPMTSRTDIEADAAMGLTDIMHVVLGLATIGIEIAAIAYGARAFGKTFRVYSYLSIAALVVFWGWSLGYSPRIAAQEPTPWLGVVERIALASWLLWVSVLAVALLREGMVEQPVREGRPSITSGS